MKRVVICLLILLIGVIGCDSKQVPSTHTNQQTYEVIVQLNREGAWGGAFLDYNVFINDHKVGQISNSDMVNYRMNLPEGEYTIYVKYGLRSKKLKFYVDENHTNFKFSCKTKSILGIDIWEEYSQ